MFSCCCQNVICTNDAIMCYAVIGAWKLDALANPAATRPHCRYFSTLTMTVVDTQAGPVTMCVIRIVNRFEKGVDLTTGTGGAPLVPRPYVESIAGGNPCAPGSVITLAGRSNSSDTGFRLGAGCPNFNGYVEVAFSDEVFLADAEAAAQVLAAQIDWPSIPIGNTERVYRWLDGGIVIEPGFQIAGTLNVCQNASIGQYHGAGNASRIAYQAPPRPPEFAPGGSLSWLPYTFINGSATGNVPGLGLYAISWQSRFSIPGTWCRYTGVITADTNGFPGACNLSNNEAWTCGPYLTRLQEPAGGSIIIAPGVERMQYTVVGCNQGATCG